MPLAHCRVLDLTQAEGLLCGQILSDLGADVIQVEPPGGAAGRRLAPFAEGHVNDVEHSLFWWSYSSGKRSLLIDIDSERATFLKLVAQSDVLIESEPPGSMKARGLDYESLSAINPRLILVTMNPYGSRGPKSSWAASDITLVAASGPMILTGDEDRPPLRVSVPQAWHHGAAEAATGALIALHERNKSARGQHVEVSVQQALTLATQANILAAAVGDFTPQRVAGGVKAGELRIRFTYPAKDGLVSITHLFGATIGPATDRLMEYVFQEGFCDEATRNKDWIEYGLLLLNGEEPLSEFERVKACVAACTATKTKAELLEAAMKKRLLLAPMSTVKDVLDSEQLASRCYFQRPIGEGRSAGLRYPGPFAKFSKTPLRSRRRPPRMGEHTKEILAELSELVEPVAAAKRVSSAAPLAGVKILDFMWALAGPCATRILADWGATVIRVESSTRLCAARTVRPFMGQDESSEKSALFHTTNAGKKMLTLNLSSPEGLSVARDLVAWADVVAESFSPKAMKSFGLDYESLQEINPSIIMLSTCLMGQSGPLSAFAGYGNLAAAIVGFSSLAGWPDRDPAGPFGAYTDYIAPRYNAISILAALEHKRLTGEGQYIDLSQAEAALHFIAPALLEFEANGRVRSGMGNIDLNFVPHGAYPVAGDDQYIAIACETEKHWLALCDHVGSLDRSLSQGQRIDRQAVIDELISAFTRDKEGMTLEASLQASNIPAAILQNSPELIRDSQLQYRGHFVELPHHEGGNTVIESNRIHMSKSVSSMDVAAPTFNRDMMFVLEEVLGYESARIGELLVSGALE